MMKYVLAAAALLAALPIAASAQDVENGKTVAKKCMICHKFDGANAVGPHLNGVVGRKAGVVEGYAYSDAMKNSGLTWDEATLGEYIADPKTKVPKNKMIFVGVKDETERKDLIAYLATLK